MIEIKQRCIPENIPDLAYLPLILQRIYASRGITSAAQLDKSLQVLLSFEQLTGISIACERLAVALQQQQRILIIGDFDADGATATALAVSALRAMGGQCIDYLVPNRFEFGYGLTPGIVQVAALRKSPQVIITVDNGVTSFDGVDAANLLNIDVIITDHHLAGEQLPNACAIVNPNQHDDAFLSKSIAGVGVIFYVMVALRRHLEQNQWFVQQNLPQPNMGHFLDLVALGTVADVVPLDQNNRILVNQGLMRINQGLTSPGILALIKVAGKNYENLRENDLGFAIAPRLNAAGRLDDMSLGIECLLTHDIDTAHQLASQLDKLNKERRLIENDMKEQAYVFINQFIGSIDKQKLPVALCLMDQSWHQGVIGILAGRLKERYHRPTIIFAYVNDEELKGSARSVTTLNIRDILAAIDRLHPGLINKFGGHAMAAGLSIHPNDFARFQWILIDEVQKHLSIAQCVGNVFTDGPLMLADLNLETAKLLQNSGPWGQKFPEPCFDNVFNVVNQRLVGLNHLKLILSLPKSQLLIEGIAFNIDKDYWPNYRVKQVHIAYRLDINIYNGNTRLQLLIEAIYALN